VLFFGLFSAPPKKRLYSVFSIFLPFFGLFSVVAPSPRGNFSADTLECGDLFLRVPNAVLDLVSVWGTADLYQQGIKGKHRYPIRFA